MIPFLHVTRYFALKFLQNIEKKLIAPFSPIEIEKKIKKFKTISPNRVETP